MEALETTPAASPAQIVRIRPARSIPVWQAEPVLQAGVSPQAVFPGSADLEAVAVPEPRQGRTEPAEPVDSMEVPGQSCLWIPRYWGCVSNVFSCRLQQVPTVTGIPHYPRQHQCCAHRHILSRTRKGTLFGKGFREECGSEPVFISPCPPKCYDQEFGGIACCNHSGRQSTQTQKPRTHPQPRRKITHGS